MNKRHQYNSIIERKLEQLPAADGELLWNDMHSILDKKMPQKKERRRFILWFLSSKGLLLLTAVFLIGGSSLFLLSTKENSTTTTKKSAVTSQSINFIDDGIAKISRETKENITTIDESNQLTKDNISATRPLGTRAVDPTINNNFSVQQITKQPKKYKAGEKFTIESELSQPMQLIFNPSSDFDLVNFNLGSINHFQITSDLNIKKYSLKQLEPVSDKIKAKVKTDNKNSDEHEFYYGIVSGLDLSSIRFQSAKGGTNKGFIIGYAFNKKWSIESGLLWDTKRVFDDGSNFDPPGYTPVNGIKIVAVNGKTRLYELPVNLKYTIISGKHNLFATTGLSSYIMKSENYDYEYTQNNQPGGHNYISYANATKNWFSVANFSIGYTHKLANIGSIRVEPYLKLPLKNIGVGKMPIMSTGLNVGFTKPLRK